MLYHWYELDLNSAPAEQRLPAHHRLHDVSGKYDALAAIKKARGGSIRSNLENLELTAANDHQPDQQAVRLRETGLGQISKFHVAAEAGGASTMQRFNQRLCFALCVTYCALLSALYFLRQWYEGNHGRQGHKMVANGTEHSTVSSYGAQRQRFKLSVK